MIKFRFLLIFLISSLPALSGHSRTITDYSSKSLSLKDYSQMRSLIQNRIRESKESLSKENPTVGVDEAVEHLKESLKLVLMKPDRDHKSPSLILMLQNEIMNYRSFDVAFREVVEETVQDFKSSKNNPKYQVSLLYALENSMAYLKSVNNNESSRALQKIAGANLSVSKEMTSYLYLEMGRGKPLSPSSTAKLILKERLKAKRAEALRAKSFEEKQRRLSAEKLTTVKENKEAYRESASKKKPKKRGFMKSIQFWLSPKKSETAENPDETEDKKKEEYLEIIKIDL